MLTGRAILELVIGRHGLWPVIYRVYASNGASHANGTCEEPARNQDPTKPIWTSLSTSSVSPSCSSLPSPLTSTNVTPTNHRPRPPRLSPHFCIDVGGASLVFPNRSCKGLSGLVWSGPCRAWGLCFVPFEGDRTGDSRRRVFQPTNETDQPHRQGRLGPCLDLDMLWRQR